MSRQAALLVADEIFYNLVGKATLQGVYHSDLVIPTEGSAVAQLLFYFLMETDVADAFRSLSVEVILPGNDPIRHTIPVIWPVTREEGRRREFYRHPLLIQNAILRPGRIEAKVIHEAGEIVVGAPWITIAGPPVKTN
jgi:hypothetical protein